MNLKTEVEAHLDQVNDMITFYHEMNPRMDHGIRNGTVHALLSNLDVVKIMLEMLHGQL